MRRSRLSTMSNGETPIAARTMPTTNEKTTSWTTTRSGEPPKKRVREDSIEPVSGRAIVAGLIRPSPGPGPSPRPASGHADRARRGLQLAAAAEQRLQERRGQRFREIESLRLAAAPSLEQVK